MKEQVENVGDTLQNIGLSKEFFIAIKVQATTKQKLTNGIISNKKTAQQRKQSRE
jgi:hypothetical protein